MLWRGSQQEGRQEVSKRPARSQQERQEARKRPARGQQDVFCFTDDSFIRKDHVRVALLCYGRGALAGCSGGVLCFRL